MGFTASVVPDGDPHGLPFGVTLDWTPPVTKTPEYREKVLNQDASGLLAYVVHAKEIVLRALSSVLQEAGFRALADHVDGDACNYRVLKAPRVVGG
ncbi:hypothetical protein [Amycolatopsis silviterrae]|uniref:Uncharacterized protein n=1 Tax=Amycolatopsis silviterrae TaxID=1656914 RepID=A0ABW5H236_9PSEU